jgi:hypothetical protein
MFEQKRFAGRHLLTFESQKLNYFGNFDTFEIKVKNLSIARSHF